MKLLFTLLLPALFAGPGAGQVPSAASRGEPVYMLTYDHGGLVLWGIDHFREKLEGAVDWLERYPGFKIGLDNEAYVYDYLANHDPSLIREINGYLDRFGGRFGIGSSTYGQPLSVFIGGESNIRQIGYALEANRKYFDYTNTIYLMSEHAMHAQIPQILNGFGFRGAIMRTHYMMYGYNPTFDAPFGWWRGIDGSRIPAVPTYEGEGAEFGKTPVDNWILTRYPGPECDISLEDFRQQFSHINPLLATRADDSDLRREELVRMYEGNPGFRWILLDELLSLYPEPETEFVTLPNDFRVRMPWGYCGNEIWNSSRGAEVLVLSAERLNALSYLVGGEDDEMLLRESWKHLLLAQHHDVQIVGLLPVAREHLGLSKRISEDVIEHSFQYLTARVKGEGAGQVTVFNPLSWEREVWIETGVDFPKGEAKGIRVTCGGEQVPSRIIRASRYSDGSILDGKVVFKAASPGLGIRNYSLLPLQEETGGCGSRIGVDHERLRITTPLLVVDLDSTGGLKGVTDRRTGKEVLSGPDRGALFSGLINGEEQWSRGRWVIGQEGEGTPWIMATEYGFIGDIPYEFRIRILEDSPTIECRVAFDFNGQKIGGLSDNERESVSPFVHEEKLRFKFFPAVDGQTVGIRDLPFAVSETEDRYIEGNYWTAIWDGTSGIAVFNRGNMGLVRESDGGFSIPLAYAMYYIWGTRMLNGRYQYEFALHPFYGEWKEADLHRKAMAYNFPLLQRSAPPGEGTIGDRIEPVKTRADHVVMSAFYTEGGKVKARWYETEGTGESVSLELDRDYMEVVEVDLAGGVLGRFNSPIHFNPWQIRTIRIEPHP